MTETNATDLLFAERVADALDDGTFDFEHLSTMLTADQVEVEHCTGEF